MTLAVMREDGQRTMEDEDGVPGGVGADTASFTFERELGTGLEDRTGRRPLRADRARPLRGSTTGTYGTCERCGKVIGHERLAAPKAATLCINDQRLADRG